MTTEVNDGTVVLEEKKSPNADYKTNPLLDENGNPKAAPPSKDEEQPKADVLTTEQETKQEPTDWSKLEGVQKLEKFLVDAGLKPSDVTKEVIESGGKITPSLLKTLEEKYGAGVAALITDQVLDLYKRGEAVAKAAETAIYTQVAEAFKDVTQQDGAETFKELSAWAKDNVAKETRVELNKMLDAGGFQATLAIGYLVQEFKGTVETTTPAGLITADNVSNTSGLVPLTRQQYRAEQEKLLAKGHSESSPEMVKLDRARQLGMKRGI